METRDRRRAAKLVPVALAAASLFLALGAGTASGAPAGSAPPAKNCWQQIVNDWIQHNGTIRGTYPIPCYSQAIQHLNGYADIQGYSNIIDDIHRALLAALHQQRSGGSGPTSGIGGGGPLGSGGSGTKPPPPTGGGNHSWVKSLADKLGPGNARSIPLPLLVLGALAVLLLLAAVATWFARRMQARRVAPAPAPATGPRDRR